MVTRLEIVLEHDDTFFFQLRTADGEVVLRSLGSPSKIMTQNEILHLRSAIRDDSHWIPHEGDDRSHFYVLKDKDGSVLAKSTHTKTLEELEKIKQIIVAAGSAPMIDLTKKHSSHAH